MKKKIIIITLIIIAIGIGLFLILRNQNKKEDNKYNDKLSELITETNWLRDGGGDTEHIRFKKDGSYVYYCACGNPVGDSDLYDLYVYDKETDTIKVYASYDKKEYELIKIKEVDELKLVLDFDGNERTFYAEDKFYLIENPLEFAGIKFESINPTGITLEFNVDGTFEAFDHNKSEFAFASDYCFYWTYAKDSNEIKIECNGEEPKLIKINKYNKDTKEVELKITYENKIIKFKPQK